MTITRIFISILLLAAGSVSPLAASDASPGEADSAFEVLAAEDVQWQKLNPARGDKSPQAGTLWGDRKGEVPTGFLAKFIDGFSSPPHIHNATYRAVVIDGLIHNDDPDAAKMWMPPGSFWTQPKGETHITASQGVSVALVEIDLGPYLVKPPEEAFDSGERPINMVPDNIVWVEPPGFPVAADGPKTAYLWGSVADGEDNGTFLKLPAGFTGTIQTNAPTFRAVVIHGQLQHEGAEGTTLLPGSYFGSKGDFSHRLSSKAGVTLYIRTVGRYALTEDG